ncbi:MAG TPA: hypothetical protein VGT44_23085 [Ktedonobacteraceae bacterium]|nr:hypothetical protein [Ktedonobacteraceae bacterium]
MKRWMLALLVVGAVVLVGGVFVFRFAQARLAPPPVFSHLARAPNLVYKFKLCLEAFTSDSINADPAYKTNYTFRDPFRSAEDTIIPTLISWNSSKKTASFQVVIIVGQIQTFRETITQVSALDGIFVMLPDTQDLLQRANEPQFVVSAINASGSAAVLDYTCSQEWVWGRVK